MERNESETPLQDQIEDGASAHDRLARLLEIDDSPIRRKVAFQALESQMPKPKITEEQAFRKDLIAEDLSSYGPVSKMIEK